MPLRRQLPVYSPLSASAVAAGLGALMPGEPRSLEKVSQQMATRFGARAITVTDSGTSALRLALSVWPGAIVALPAYSRYDLVAAAVGAGVRVVLIDLEPQTVGPDVASFTDAVAQGAKVAVVAGLFGLPPDMQAIRGICDQKGVLLIEDAAQGTGGRL